jgi:hypothetical protein
MVTYTISIAIAFVVGYIVGAHKVGYVHDALVSAYRSIRNRFKK